MLATDLMHKHNIFHRDIKPDNILILDKNEMLVCIADLGLACRREDLNALNSKCGTPGYVDPEVLEGTAFSTRSDVYSLGVLLFNLITGRYLFHGNDAEIVLEKNRKNIVIKTIEDTCFYASSECKDLLNQML